MRRTGLPLPTLGIAIEASPALVFQLVAAVGQGRDATHARVLRRPSPEVAIVEFTTRVLGRQVRTLEEVRFYPPDRITYRLLRGPLPAVNEEFRVESRDGGTMLVYRGTFEAHPPWPRTVLDRLLVPWLYRSAVWKSMLDIKRAAEERQKKSVLFKREAGGTDG